MNWLFVGELPGHPELGSRAIDRVMILRKLEGKLGNANITRKPQIPGYAKSECCMCCICMI